MKKSTLLFLSILLTLLSSAQSPKWLWANMSLYATGEAIPAGVVADRNEDIYATGHFNSDSLGFGQLTIYNGAPSNGTPVRGVSLFLTKFTSAGQQVWAKAIGGKRTTVDVVSSIATDKDRNVFLTGWFAQDSIRFDSITLRTDKPFGTTAEMYLVKYNTNGNVLWARQAKCGLSSMIYSYSVAVDSSGNSYVLGHLSMAQGDSVSFGSFKYYNSVPNSKNAFIVKYYPNGNVAWFKVISGTSVGSIVAIDSHQDVVVAGEFWDSLSLGSGIVIRQQYPLIGNNRFLLKYTSSGNIKWGKVLGCSSVKGVSFDNADNIFLTGSFSEGSAIDAYFDSDTLHHIGYSTNFYLAKYSPSGSHIWSKAGGSPQGEVLGASVVVDPFGNPVIAGDFPNQLIFDKDTLYQPSGATPDGYLIKFRSNGTLLWKKGIGATGVGLSNPTNLSAISASNSGIVVGGYFGCKVSFDSLQLSPPNCGTYGISAFFAKVDVPCSVTKVITSTICMGSSYDFYGQNLSTNGTYSHTIVGYQGGCDSIFQLQLTIAPPPVVNWNSQSDTVPLTGNQIILTGGSPSGGTYTGAGVYQNIFYPDSAGLGSHLITYTYTDANGCTDSTSRLYIVTVTGIGVASPELEIILYPQPVRESLVVENWHQRDAKPEAIDLLGRIHPLEFYKEGNKTKLNVTQLKPGVYLLRLAPDSIKKFIRVE